MLRPAITPTITRPKHTNNKSHTKGVDALRDTAGYWGILSETFSFSWKESENAEPYQNLKLLNQNGNKCGEGLVRISHQNTGISYDKTQLYVFWKWGWSWCTMMKRKWSWPASCRRCRRRRQRRRRSRRSVPSLQNKPRDQSLQQTSTEFRVTTLHFKCLQSYPLNSTPFEQTQIPEKLEGHIFLELRRKECRQQWTFNVYTYTESKKKPHKPALRASEGA